MKTALEIKSRVFPLVPLFLSTGVEQILPGGRKLFHLLPSALKGIKKIVFVGWGKQAPAQALNFRDSLREAGSDITVGVALRTNSESRGAVREYGFNEKSGTLGTVEQLLPDADLVLLLIDDAAQTENWKEITGLLKPGATLGFSHGFLIGHLCSTGERLRNDINVVMVAPKGVGDSVRKLYLQGKEMGGAGINASVAVFQAVDFFALDRALAWSVAIGSPVTFFTTMGQEVISDIVGERGPLLGALWGLVEARYDQLCSHGAVDTNQAFLLSAKGLTSTVTALISKYGLLGFYNKLDDVSQAYFFTGYAKAYRPAKNLQARIYDEVSSWREIAKVVKTGKSLGEAPMSLIETTEMWKVGKDLYKAEVPMSGELAFTAGMYVGLLMAGIETLIENGHCGSEAYNEQLIEAIDSLNPLMDKSGVGYMIDRCSRTARLGAREWGPKFQEVFTESLEGPFPAEARIDFLGFLTSPVHPDIAECYKLRPSVKLVV